MTHYTCTECHTLKEQPGACTDENCLKEGQELTSCECTNGEHGADDNEDSYAKY